ncbi:unnamed protein product [Prorocentrum cordatum]|uniref:Nuclear pore complex protein Nup85 n=1 Tax=Prorocentrum cordatum TaxID=2364126 RepID=A0ABN9Y9K0_9DINO|nr:unnamed protein product [Polarella glacialis]
MAQTAWELIKQFCRPSCSANDADMLQLSRLLEVTKRWLHERFVRFVRSAKDRPLLMSYSCDGAPTVSTARKTFGTALLPTIRRSGKGCDEYLVHTVFAAFHDGSGVVRCTKMREPMPMTAGKCTPPIFAAAMQFHQTLPQLNHQGISVHHYSWDRALFSSMRTLYRKYHVHLIHNNLDGGPNEMSQQLRYHLNWPVFTGCGLHDAHKGQEWALHAEYADGDILRRVHIAVESLRNSYTQLMRWMPLLVASIDVVPAEECLPEETLRALWGVLGVPGVLLEELVGWRLCCVGGKLQATTAVHGDVPDFFDRISYCIASLWKFTKFSESRWVSVGWACKRVACAILSGVDIVVRAVQDDPHEINWYINGWGDLREDGRHLVFVCAVSTKVSDTILALMLHDARLAKNIDEVETKAFKSLQTVAEIDASVWRVFADACYEGCPPLSLQSKAIHCAQVSLALVTWRALDDARGLPWSLATGDVDGKLDALAAGDMPQDAVAARVYCLLQCGWPRADIKRGLSLLLECPWSTRCAEQLHASLTLMKRYHPDAGQETLIVRAGVHSMRLLLPGLNALEKQAAVRREKLARLGRKCPEKITGRHIFLKELVDLAVSKRQARGLVGAGGADKKLVARHGAKWNAMGPRSHQSFDNAAIVERQAKRRRIEDEKEQVRGELAAAREKIRKQGEETPPLGFRACQLSDADMEALDSAFQSSSWIPARWPACGPTPARRPAHLRSCCAHWPRWTLRRRATMARSRAG